MRYVQPILAVCCVDVVSVAAVDDEGGGAGVVCGFITCNLFFC